MYFLFLIIVTVQVILCFVFVSILGSILPCSLPFCCSKIIDILVGLLFARISFPITKKLLLSKRIKPDDKAVFITGCDHGFGHMLAKKLDSEGFYVYASCLYPSGPGATDLRQKSSNRLKILELDVTRDESVQKAVEFVKADLKSLKLWAIVNNAGILKGISIELTELRDFKDCMEVNLFGVIRVTKAFLPLLRRSKGRIVNITSLGGRVAPCHLSAYTVSKFAASGLTDCLRRELDVWGIHVISIEPEMFQTPIADFGAASKRMDETFASLDASIKEDYGVEYFDKFKKFAGEYAFISSEKIYKVIDDLESAITLEHPSTVYRSSRNIITQMIAIIAQNLPTDILDFIIKISLFFINAPVPKRTKDYF
ncbi:estradiol 17-beta-dehydrogenase 2 [Nephila pilipes]|uniref:Estradiol 17-beta-dehydrogenase 2 n=1 Tax=Nephila pilipes TaxID=299642 RepID=A0A8X6NAI3_NEPPI|nr:estradiol 17-beta-dehydrogenase 2 [Nephila pilipes]